jgi:RimJ/RimL family protein N-acetyltransferase
MRLAPEYPVETERLRLRPLDPQTDPARLAVYQSQPDVCRYIPYAPRGAEEIEAILRDPARNRSFVTEAPQALSLGVELRATGELVGDVMVIWRSAEHRSVELGYVFDPAHRGHGYATEAGRAMLAIAFDVLDAHRVVARIDSRNEASAAVLRRLGLRQEAVLVENEFVKGEWTTEIDFAILATEWRADT